MVKIHTRAKKKFGLSTHGTYGKKLPNLHKKKGPKTFKTEEAANKYAEENGIKSFKLKKVKKNKKFQIVEKWLTKKFNKKEYFSKLIGTAIGSGLGVILILITPAIGFIQLAFPLIGSLLGFYFPIQNFLYFKNKK